MEKEPRSIKEIFAENFKFYRKQKNLTQAELAEVLNISVNSVNNIENCKQFPKPETIDKMIECCQLEPSQLFQENSRKYYSAEQVNLIFQNLFGKLGNEINLEMESLVDTSYEFSRGRK